MSKKQKKTKTVIQNKRNKLLNMYYKSRIKNISKTLAYLFKKNELKNDFNLNDKKKVYETWCNSYFSVLDKAVKKNVIHINNAAKKKSKLNTCIFNFILKNKK